MLRALCNVLLLASLGTTASAELLTQVDSFDPGHAFGWGGDSQPFTIEMNGGPQGAGDGFFAYSSHGTGGPGARMVIPNEANGNQWSGDYLAAGVTGYALDVSNPGASQLDLRVAVANGGTWYVSSDPVVVPESSDWVSVAFMVSEDAMTRVGSGTDDFATVMSDVGRVRLLSSAGLPPVSFGGTGGVQGDLIVASIGFDNFRAIGVPEPTSLLMIAAGWIVARRRWR